MTKNMQCKFITAQTLNRKILRGKIKVIGALYKYRNYLDKISPLLIIKKKVLFYSFGERKV